MSLAEADPYRTIAAVRLASARDETGGCGRARVGGCAPVRRLRVSVFVDVVVVVVSVANCLVLMSLRRVRPPRLPIETRRADQQDARWSVRERERESVCV
ncbi:hypothetical protein LZ31DRAFT_554862 [Colletotrichum somersetense]|nr:hypothetical protein LZ31DRAFT_554862 [Colletotrichum somersetense]